MSPLCYFDEDKLAHVRTRLPVSRSQFLPFQQHRVNKPGNTVPSSIHVPTGPETLEDNAS